MKLRGIDRITILYNLIVVLFVGFFRAKIHGYQYHLGFNLSVILFILWICRLREKSSLFRVVSQWYPLALYTFFYYQTGLINRVLIPSFLDEFFMNLDVTIFRKFPGYYMNSGEGNRFLDEFFHFFYFSYYLIIPGTGILLYRKDERLFEKFVFQISSLFYLCYLVYVVLPVEGPLHLRDTIYREGGVFRAIVDFIYEEGENPGAAFPSSHVAVTYLVAWWGSRHLPRLKQVYWCIFLFLSISTVYCYFHYAVDVVAGIALAISMTFLFDGLERRRVR